MDKRHREVLLAARAAASKALPGTKVTLDTSCRTHPRLLLSLPTDPPTTRTLPFASSPKSSSASRAAAKQVAALLKTVT